MELQGSRVLGGKITMVLFDLCFDQGELGVGYIINQGVWIGFGLWCFGPQGKGIGFI